VIVKIYLRCDTQRKSEMSKIAENTPNQANYLCSPMQKSLLNSPQNACKNRKKVDDKLLISF
jgi:hypothetical protein